MATPLISIIIPIYNTGNFLKRCFDSILGQSFTNFELLLVDDGSTDQSGEICRKYEIHDNRVKVFYKQNGGVSSARNLGLQHARGKWIAFVDSDDCLADNALPDQDFEEDLILFPHFMEYPDGSCVLVPCEFADRSFSQSDKHFLSQHISDGAFRTIWSKLFNRKLIGDLRFDEDIPIGEDHLFLLEYMSKIKTYRIEGTPFYVYNRIDAPLFAKYQISVEKSIYILSKLIRAYRENGAASLTFEKEVFCDYKSFCQNSIYENPKSWYGNAFIKQLYHRIHSELPTNYKIRYGLLSIPLFSYLWNVFLTHARR